MRKACLLVVLISSSLIACKKEYSGWNVYYNSKMNLIRIPANEDCPEGGVLVQSGLDKNQNDILDSAEIDQAETICNGAIGGGSAPDTTVDGPKQIIIQLDMMTANMSSTSPIIVGGLPYFSKLYYPGYDSIVVVGRPYINPNDNNTTTLQLYDLTNNEVIANSTISSNKGLMETGWVVSKNIYSALPDQEITLGVKLWSGQEGMFAGVYDLYLYLYRK